MLRPDSIYLILQFHTGALWRPSDSLRAAIEMLVHHQREAAVDLGVKMSDDDALEEVDATYHILEIAEGHRKRIDEIFSRPTPSILDLRDIPYTERDPSSFVSTA